jgi:hypothetical protein
MNAILPSIEPGPRRSDVKAIPEAGEAGAVIRDGGLFPKKRWMGF